MKEAGRAVRGEACFDEAAAVVDDDGFGRNNAGAVIHGADTHVAVSEC